jgi:hypothetical protein
MLQKNILKNNIYSYPAWSPGSLGVSKHTIIGNPIKATIATIPLTPPSSLLLDAKPINKGNNNTHIEAVYEEYILELPESLLVLIIYYNI